MSWNYRVIRKATGSPVEPYTFQIHEVYYKGAKPTSWSYNPMDPHGADLEELERDLGLMSDALKQPVLDVYQQNGVTKLRELCDCDKTQRRATGSADTTSAEKAPSADGASSSSTPKGS